ncbi:hypothetical protein ACFOMH_14295 [Paracoccus mangrovi]|uniref:Apea-like HEPN domain-containing protein n=1 Tax=Paracoccus mangrovi TaxID=1715645 RepID=A0ABV7R4P6_9RHOB
MLYHPDPTIFIENSVEYGALGKAMVSLSNLEFAHDEFVFAMHKTDRDLSIGLSKKFPRHFREKTDFLIDAVFNVSKLRRIPFFATGELNLLWLQYQLDEIYEVRSIIAHGSIFFSESTEDRITWRFDRYVQGQKNTWAPEAVKISNGYLASVHYSASAIKNYIVRLTMCLEDRSCWEKEYQADKEIRQNRKLVAELAAAGVIVDSDGWIRAFPALSPIE